MFEPAFKVMLTLARAGEALDVGEVVRRSHESTSAVRRVLEEYPRWFAVEPRRSVGLTPQGERALLRELAHRMPLYQRDDRRAATPEEIAYFAEIAAFRGRVKRSLDQTRATVETVFRRATLLVERGETQRGIAFLGDADLTAVATDRRAPGFRGVVFDVDRDVLHAIEEHAARTPGSRLQAVHADLTEPMPRAAARRFGAAFLDPPYTPAGVGVFLSRAREALKPDGRAYLSLGESGRARHLALERQRAILELGWLVEEVIPDFNEYDGAHSIGATASLYVLSQTPQTRVLRSDEFDRAALYTRRRTASAPTDRGARRPGRGD